MHVALAAIVGWAAPAVSRPAPEAPIPMESVVDLLAVDAGNRVVAMSRGRVSRPAGAGLERLGPDKEVRGAAISADGRWAALVGWSDGKVADALRIVDLTTGAEQTGPGFGRITSGTPVAFAPDAGRIAIGAAPYQAPAVLYVVDADARTRKEFPLGDCSPATVGWLSASRIVVGCADKSEPMGVRLVAMDAATGVVGPGPKGVIGHVADGRWLGVRDQRFTVIDPATGAALYTSPAGTWRFALSPDGQLAALSGAAGLSVVSVPDGREVQRWDVGEDSAYRMAFSRDGAWLVAARGTSIHKYDVGTGAVLASAPAHRDEVHALLTLPDGRVISGDRTGLRLIWTAPGVATLVEDAPPGAASAARTLPEGMEAFVYRLAVSADGQRAASVHPYGVQVFDTTSGRAVAAFPMAGDVAKLPRIEVPAAPRDGGCIVNSSDDYAVPAFDGSGRRLLFGGAADPTQAAWWVQQVDLDQRTRTAAWVLSDRPTAVGYDRAGEPVAHAGTRVVALRDGRVIADSVERAWLGGPDGRMAWQTTDDTVVIDEVSMILGGDVQVLGWQAGALIARRELEDRTHQLYRIDRRTLEPVAQCPTLSYPLAWRPPDECAWAEIMRGAVHLGR